MYLRFAEHILDEAELTHKAWFLALKVFTWPEMIMVEYTYSTTIDNIPDDLAIYTI